MAPFKRYNTDPIPVRQFGGIENDPAVERARHVINATFDDACGTVDLSGFGLNCLPKEVEDLHHLRSVNLTTKRLLAKEIHLFLHNNYLVQLLPQLFSLDNLTVLILRNNRIKEIPQAIGQLVNLRELSVAGNRLRDLPVELKQLSSLRSLTTRPNQLWTKSFIKQDAKGPPSLSELALRLATCSPRISLTSSNCTEEIMRQSRSHNHCSHCNGLYFTPAGQVVIMERLLGQEVPLCYHVCSAECHSALQSIIAKVKGQSGGSEADTTASALPQS